MAVTIWSIDLDAQAGREPVDGPLPTDLIVEIRRPGQAPSQHRMRASEFPALRRPEHPARRLRVRRPDA